MERPTTERQTSEEQAMEQPTEQQGEEAQTPFEPPMERRAESAIRSESGVERSPARTRSESETQRRTMKAEERRGSGGVHAVDVPQDRPGVPMAATPPRPARGAHWKEPARQSAADEHLHRTGLERPTPVVGTAQPPHGISGLIRRKAYDMPEHLARHWMLLFLADRVDVLEDRIGPALARPMEKVGLLNGSRVARSNPLGLIAGVVVGAWLTKRVLF